MTAAHCFVDKDGYEMNKEQIKEMTVIVGANAPTDNKTLTKRRRFIQTVKINPKIVSLHRKYDVATQSAYYDVAIAKIRGRFR